MLQLICLEMDDLKRVNSEQLYTFWKNLSIGLLAIIALLAVSHMLPYFAAPIVAFIVAGVLYTLLYNNGRVHNGSNCMVVTYVILYCVINYTIVSILINVLSIWNILPVPDEFLFLNHPYLPSLILDPVCCLTCLVMYVRRKKIGICQDCRVRSGGLYERGKLGNIFQSEAYYQIRNLFYLFGILSLIVWSYYEFVYIRLALNSRDWYVFTWLTIIAFLLDELYFVARYYNLYIDLKENDEIITQEELQDMTAKTYLRFYVICDNKIFLDPHAIVPGQEHKEVLDSPFITRRSVNGIPIPEVRNIIRRLTGQEGELRFFYGRRRSDLKNHSLLRYFYFLDGKPEDYPEMPVDGEWFDFEDIKRMYTRTPGKFAPRAISDLSRLATIILTEKIFNENGERKIKLKSYSPTFNLHDVRNSTLDFQDDKWVKISMFNSDTPFFHVRKLFRPKGAKAARRGKGI